MNVCLRLMTIMCSGVTNRQGLDLYVVVFSYAGHLTREVFRSRFLLHGFDHAVQGNDTPFCIDMDAGKVRQCVCHKLGLNRRGQSFVIDMVIRSLSRRGCTRCQHDDG